LAKTTKAAPASAPDQPSEPTPSFEESLAALEALVDQLEQGDLPLEEALATFERGVHLSRGCQKALDAAEQRVRILTESGEEANAAASAETTAAFEPSAAAF
jgi:exodeoxyribonuclease VII small subunit